VLDQVQPALDRLDEDQQEGLEEEANQDRQQRRLERLAQITAPLRNPQQVSLARDQIARKLVPGRPEVISELYAHPLVHADWERLKGRSVHERVRLLASRSDLAEHGLNADRLLVASYEVSVQAALAFPGVTKPKSKGSKQMARG
jgi:primosomal protein N''